MPRPRKINHLKRVERTAAALERARDARDEAVREAYESGESLRAIGEVLGMSHEGVRFIVQGGEGGKGKRTPRRRS